MAEEEKKEKSEEAAEEKAVKQEGEIKEAPVEEKKEEPKEEPKKEEKKAEKPAPSGKFADLIKQIEQMPVAELSDLVKALEERFGVSASAPVAAPTTGGAGAPTESAGEEKTSFNVILKDAGAQKIAVIKAVREINQDLGLVDAKNLVEGAPKEVRKDLPKEEAEEAKKKLEAAGATVELT